MNILPKKKWHVRTSENIARVRRDEAKAAEDAKEVERRSLLAEQEARTSLLRARAREKLGYSEKEELKQLDEPDDSEEALIGPSVSELVPVSDSGVISSNGHVNFFQDLEEGQKNAKENEEHEEEKKKEQEEYEKKVGYLTYLGQDTEELTGDQVWWKKLPSNRRDIVSEEKGKSSVGTKQKDFLDPLKDLRKYLGCDGVQLTLRKYEKKIEKTEQKALGFQVDKKGKRERSKASLSKKKKHRRDYSSDSSEHRKRSKKRRREPSMESEKGHSQKKMRKHSPSPSKSHKYKKRKKDKHRKKSKRKRSSRESSSSDSNSEPQLKVQQRANLDKLRQERLARERKEKERTHKLLYGEPEKEEKPVAKVPEKVQKYNSQYNPDIAKQNKLDPNKKYWLD